MMYPRVAVALVPRVVDSRRAEPDRDNLASSCAPKVAPSSENGAVAVATAPFDCAAAARRQGVAAAGFEKSTVGGAFRIAGSVTSKYFRCFAPVTFAVIAVGNWRM